MENDYGAAKQTMRQWVRRQLFSAILYLHHLLYPLFIAHTILLMPCKRAGSKSYMLVGMVHECYGKEHTMWFVFLALPSMIFYRKRPGVCVLNGYLYAIGGC